MRTIDYESVLKATADICALDRDNISNDEFRILRSSHSDRLHTAWEFEYWPELVRVEKRYFRDLWNDTDSYAAPTLTSATEVYYSATGKYYQTVLISSGVAPADINGDTNTTLWADSKTSYSADNYSSTTTYAVGDVVYYPTTDRYYHCHTIATNKLPSDTLYWGVLTDFDRYVDYEQTGRTAIGEFLEVWRDNPRTTTRTRTILSSLSENGIQVSESANFGWIEFKTRVPILSGENYSETATYAVDDQVYFDTGVKGNFYNCITATAAGEDPVDTPAKWSVVEIPLIFKEYMENGGFADWLLQEGQISKSLAREQMADKKLHDKVENLTGSQDQRKRNIVLVR